MSQISLQRDNKTKFKIGLKFNMNLGWKVNHSFHLLSDAGIIIEALRQRKDTCNQFVKKKKDKLEQCSVVMVARWVAAFQASLRVIRKVWYPAQYERQ